MIPTKLALVKMRLSDPQIDAIRPIQWAPKKITVPLPKPNSNVSFSDIMQKFGLQDTSLLKQGAITFTMNPTLNYGNVQAVRVQDLMVKEIVEV